MSYFAVAARQCRRPFDAILRRQKDRFRSIAERIRRFLIEPIEEHQNLATIETDRMLMALFDRQAAHVDQAPSGPSFPAVNLADDRLLAPHPFAGFIFLDAADDFVTPRWIARMHEPGLAEWLAAAMERDTLVIDIGAGPGIETLTAGAVLARDAVAGHVLAIEPDAMRRRLLESNIRSHRLGRIVTLSPGLPEVDQIEALLYGKRRLIVLAEATPDGISRMGQVVDRAPESIEVLSAFRATVDCREVARPCLHGAVWRKLASDGETLNDDDSRIVAAGNVVSVPPAGKSCGQERETIRMTA